METHPNEPPHAIIIQEFSEIQDEEPLILLPDKMAMMCMVNRKQNAKRPHFPRNLSECVFMDP